MAEATHRVPTDDKVVAETAQAHRVLAAVLDRAAAQIDGEDFSDWSGTAADTARTKRRALAELARAHSGELTIIGGKQDEIAAETRSTLAKVSTLAAGVAVAGVVGVALTIFTAGWSTLVYAAVEAAVVVAVGEAIAAFLAFVAAAIEFLAVNYSIGLVEGVLFTGVTHGITGNPWTRADAKQIALIAAGNTIGKVVGLGAVSAIGSAAPTLAGTTGLAVGGGVITGGTLGAVNPLLINQVNDQPFDTSTYLGSILANALVGGVGGRLGYKPPTGAGAGAGEIELQPIRTQPVGGGQYVNAAGETVPALGPLTTGPVGGGSYVLPATTASAGSGASTSGGQVPPTQPVATA